MKDVQQRLDPRLDPLTIKLHGGGQKNLSFKNDTYMYYIFIIKYSS